MKQKEIWVVVEDTRGDRQIPQLKSFLGILEDLEKFTIHLINYEQADAALSRICLDAGLLMFDTTILPPAEAARASDDMVEEEKNAARKKVIRKIINEIKRNKNKQAKIVLFGLAIGCGPSRIFFHRGRGDLLPIAEFKTDEPDQLAEYVEHLLG